MIKFRVRNPGWLINIKKTGKLPEDILFHHVLSNSLLYPAAGDDYRYIYSFVKLNRVVEKGLLNEIINKIIEYETRRIFYDDCRGFENFRRYDHPHYQSYIHNIRYNNSEILNYLFDYLSVDTFILNDYLFEKESKYSYGINYLLDTLSSEFKLLAEGYIDSYKIDREISYKTAVYLMRYKKKIKEICKRYIKNSQEFDEIISKVLISKYEHPTPSWLLGNDKPTFVHWSVWEDEETKKIFNLLYFSEEAHVNLLRTYVKNRQIPKIIIFHRDGVYSHGCGWIDFFSYESPFLSILMFNGVPDLFIYQYINDSIKNYKYVIYQLYQPVYRLDFSKIVPKKFINVLNEPRPENIDNVMISNLFLEKIKSKILSELFYREM